MWAVFIFVLGLFGIFLINNFGVITTTNQQDYTLIKNAVESAMEDAKDWASYRAGFYLCIDNDSIDKNANPIKLNSKNDYHIVLKTKENEGDRIESTVGCKLLLGEFKINKEVFVESFIRRYANNINNNKSYQVTIQEVIEYPPKVSVRIDTFNTYNSSESKNLEFTASDDGYYNIQNQIDAILEDRGDREVIIYYGNEAMDEQINSFEKMISSLEENNVETNIIIEEKKVETNTNKKIETGTQKEDKKTNEPSAKDIKKQNIYNCLENIIDKCSDCKRNDIYRLEKNRCRENNINDNVGYSHCMNQFIAEYYVGYSYDEGADRYYYDNYRSHNRYYGYNIYEKNWINQKNIRNRVLDCLTK